MPSFDFDEIIPYKQNLETINEETKLNLEQILEKTEMMDIADFVINPLFLQTYDKSFEILQDHEKLDRIKETEILRQSILDLDD